MKTVVIFVGLAFVAASVGAREVVLWEDFEKVGCLYRWNFGPTEDWQWKYEVLNWYMKFEGEGGGWGWSLKAVPVRWGETYKIELYYRYGGATVSWGNQRKGLPRAGGEWTAAAFALVMPGGGSAHFHVAVPATTKKFDFDDVRVTRCGVPVAPASLGRVKALFK